MICAWWFVLSLSEFNFKFIFMHSPFDLRKPIAIGSDHAGFDYKEDLISFLEGKGLTYKDFGTHSKDSVDYPDFAHPVALAVERGEAAFGILLCGSANGVAITANKHQHIRAAICWGASGCRIDGPANTAASTQVAICRVHDTIASC